MGVGFEAMLVVNILGGILPPKSNVSIVQRQLNYIRPKPIKLATTKR